ncbi:hypothetical protein D3Z38_14115 [Clostridiales bacterium]|nr:hypothetical protein [Clostridiales bacterium]
MIKLEIFSRLPFRIWFKASSVCRSLLFFVRIVFETKIKVSSGVQDMPCPNTIDNMAIPAYSMSGKMPVCKKRIINNQENH